MTETNRNRLPDKVGYEKVQEWGNGFWDAELDDKPVADTYRLVIVGETGTGKTRAMRDMLLSHETERRKRWKPSEKECVRYPVLSAESFQKWMDIKPDGYEDCSPLDCFQDCENETMLWDYKPGKPCIDCPCLKYLPSADATVGIDDMQDFTSKKHLRYLKTLFEFWMYVVVAIQIPEGMPITELKPWLLNRLAGYNGQYQLEAEAVLRRLFEVPGLTLVHMRRNACKQS